MRSKAVTACLVRRVALRRSILVARPLSPLPTRSRTSSSTRPQPSRRLPSRRGRAKRSSAVACSRTARVTNSRSTRATRSAAVRVRATDTRTSSRGRSTRVRGLGLVARRRRGSTRSSRRDLRMLGPRRGRRTGMLAGTGRSRRRGCSRRRRGVRRRMTATSSSTPSRKPQSRRLAHPLAFLPSASPPLSGQLRHRFLASVSRHTSVSHHRLPVFPQLPFPPSRPFVPSTIPLPSPDPAYLCTLFYSRFCAARCVRRYTPLPHFLSRRSGLNLGASERGGARFPLAGPPSRALRRPNRRVDLLPVTSLAPLLRSKLALEARESVCLRLRQAHIRSLPVPSLVRSLALLPAHRLFQPSIHPSRL
ncbi:hypothetical protein BJY59DRAFT_567035 [Rhodotorula toruloides]